MTFIRNLWYVAAWSTELTEATPVGRVIAGDPIVLWRKADGVVVAMEDRCPHRHAPLSMARVKGDEIQCMYHGLAFSAAGRCLRVPASDVIPPNSTVRTYRAAERHSWIWVWMGDPALADPDEIPQAFGLDNPDWLMREGVLDYEADYQLINDNLTDLSHLDFVHATTLGAASGAQWSEDHPDVRVIDKGLRVDRWFRDLVFRPGPPTPLDTFNTYRYMLPGLFLMTTHAYPSGTAEACGFGAPPDGFEPVFARAEQQAVTPITPGRTRYLFASGVAARFGSPELLDGMMGVINAAFAEDRVMIEAQQRIWDLTPASQPKAFIPQDKAPAMFRRLIARQLEAEARPTTAVA